MGTGALRRASIVLSLALGGFVVLVLLGFCVGSLGYYVDKYNRAQGIAAPAAMPGPIRPERQTEPHTCGLHAIGASYTAYGVDPGAARLRFRLGVDKPATNFDPESLGTIHPDILRVLGQDGFEATMVGPSGAAERIRTHLKDGHPVLALVRVNTLHWLVLAGLDGDELAVVDSLAEEPYREPFDAYVRDRVLSAILVRPLR
jgi:ABC-type bacteriocin/lantibiotic exporter with double-glycine peptidase domain